MSKYRAKYADVRQSYLAYSVQTVQNLNREEKRCADHYTQLRVGSISLTCVVLLMSASWCSWP